MKHFDWSELYMDDWDDERIEIVEDEHPIERTRWGTIQEIIVKVKEPEEYFRILFVVSTDGETNALRDGDYYIEKVVPFEKTITTWKAVN